VEKPKSYCEWLWSIKAEKDNLHKIYHDTQYGFPIAGDDELFGRFLLEIFQGGLNWTIILKKQENFRRAFSGFSIEKVARYKEKDFTRLMADEGIIRNRLKIKAAIHNANVIIGIQKEHGSFKKWLDKQEYPTLDEWKKLFKKTFTFTGGEIVNEFLVSTGHLPGAHIPECEVYAKTLRKKPMWSRGRK
jgi:DNA-3-methyladenine glycosylase I